MGQGCPRRNKWDTGARKWCNKKPNGHTESLRKKQAVGPKRPNRLGLNNIIAGNGSKIVGMNKRMGWRSKNPQLNKARPLRGVSHQRMRCQKTAHAIRSQRWTVDCVDEPLDHGKRMSNKQISDIHKSEACVRPRHLQHVPSQYRTWWGHGSEITEHGLAVWGSCSGFFGENVLLGWHTAQKKQGWVGTTRCMPWGIGREREHPHYSR